ncbi:hypothetical protein [Cellulosimicrobium funkei]|uniref:hypothetical protein n=1 Tax=Cellulosimicrobium funkei TaxID=264251 RepID=UPI00368D9818
MNAPTGLRELLDQAMVRRDVRSGRRLAEIAQDAGYPVSHATINQIRSGSYASRPSDDTVRAIAWLAGASEEAAFTAADLPIPGPPFADELPPGVDTLSPRKRKVVLDLLRVLIEDEERDGDDRDAAPIKRATGSVAAGFDELGPLRLERVPHKTPISGQGGAPEEVPPGPGEPAPDDTATKHWTPVAEEDIRAGGGLPQAPAHGRSRRTSGKTKPRHN